MGRLMITDRMEFSSLLWRTILMKTGDGSAPWTNVVRAPYSSIRARTRDRPLDARRTMNSCVLFGEEHPRQIFAICASMMTNSETFTIVMHLPQLYFCQGSKKSKTSPTAGITSAPTHKLYGRTLLCRFLGIYHRLPQ